MTKFDDQYIDLCKRILESGQKIQNYSGKSHGNSAVPEHVAQNGVKTIRLPHQILQFDLSEEFPILTSKKVAFKTAILEMFWIFQVQSNQVSWLKDRGIKIWDEWEIPKDGMYMGRDFKKLYADLGLTEDPAGTIGTAYGWIVNRYKLTQNLIDTLENDPGNRRMVLSLWQNEFLPAAALPSCVWNSEWNITDGRLNLLVNSRSSDVPLGLPFNIVQYAAFCCLVAHCIGVKPGQFTFVTNDAHIYENQVDGIREQIERYEKAKADGTLPDAPKLWINPEVRDFFEFDNSKELSDIRLEGYENLGVIKMPISA
ncbi:thymidylate synthase [Candidatus Saccharibacteria bacterium]|nr:thymidylate synthase [Candidatus Saccharibacteria bacterium]